MSAKIKQDPILWGMHTQSQYRCGATLHDLVFRFDESMESQFFQLGDSPSTVVAKLRELANRIEAKYT